jgi:eukaryotic-like serine/threonine-protein kinase
VLKAMSPQRLSQLQEICRKALERPAEMRDQYLQEVCGNDVDLAHAVRARLAQAEASTLPNASPGSLLGQQLNTYYVISVLGAGGMGEVFRARDTVLEREVAIKTLPPAFASDPERLERFRREARVLASLNHPNIAGIYGFEECRGVHFLVMELVEGETLTSVIAKGIPQREVFRICSQVAEALAAAHQKEIVHRDIKPANIKLTPEGRVKVLDFGLAKVLWSRASGHDQTVTVVTQAGKVVGTPAYMSPEQLRGQTFDSRSDIWAFGCLLYEMLSRSRAFGRGSMPDTFAAILEREPDWKQIPAGTPASVGDLMRRCLQKDTRRRLESLETAQSILQKASTFEKAPRWYTRRASIVAGVLVLAGLLTVGAIHGPKGWRAKITGPPIRSLAVLPFLNVGSDKEWDYLADGVTESMINRLSRIHDLTVMSRSAVFRSRKADADAIEIGRSLHVEAVLTGTIRHFANRLEANVELVDCATGRHLWGDSYSQSFVDTLVFEKSAVEDAALHLRTRLDPSDRQSVTRDYTANLQAYRLYLRGRYEWNKRSVKASEAAIAYFRQALDIDPSYALAYSGIADAYSVESGYLPASEIFPKAQDAALKAIELDPDLAEAHASLGLYYVQYGWDWTKAEAEFRRALAANPNYPSAHSMYARLLCVLGRFPEAEAQIAKAQALDPLSSGIAIGVGLELYLARDYIRAEKHFRSVLPLDPSSANAASYLALTLTAAGRARDGVAGYRKILDADPSDVFTMADLVRAYALAGQKKEANELLGRIRKSPNFPKLLPTSTAEAYGAVGLVDQAFAELNRAFAERCWYLIFLNVEPIFDPLRQDPRFRIMQKQLSLGG